MASPKNPDVFFVGLQNTTDLRKSIIESTKDSIVFLQKYENFLHIRKEKDEAIKNLKRIVKEITNLVSSLKTKLPESEIHRRLKDDEISIEKEIVEMGLKVKNKDNDIAKAHSNARRKVFSKTSRTEEKKEKAPEKTQMEILEDQLKELEGKLRSFD